MPTFSNIHKKSFFIGLCFYVPLNEILIYINFVSIFDSEFASKMESRAGGTPVGTRKPLNRSLSNSDVAGYEKTDGSISDSAISSSQTERRKRRPSLGYKITALVGLSRKSSSTSQISASGRHG